MTISLTKQNFVEKVYNFENDKEWNFKGKRPTVIDFYADWCGPCKMLAPIFEKLSKEYEGKIDFYKVDTDKEQEISVSLGIQSLPTLFFIPIDGKPKVFVGLIQQNVFKDTIKNLFDL